MLLHPISNIFKRFYVSSSAMAKSKFEYVKNFESEDKLLPNCWIVVRIDGKSFHKFSEKHEFQKPNDVRALNLMNKAASKVMEQFKDIVLSYGESDEYSFVLKKDTEIFNRRGFKIMTYLNSLFTSSYVFYWSNYFKNVRMKYPPCFDARIVLYPTDQNLRDYLSWRQADCHVNNLYNTTFWTLILKGRYTNTEAEKRLCGSFSSDKNEILFSEFGINYNNEPEIFRKGTILVKRRIKSSTSKHFRQIVFPLNEDLIGDKFWEENSDILSLGKSQEFHYESLNDLPELVRSQLPAPKDEDHIEENSLT